MQTAVEHSPVSGHEHWTHKGDVKLFLWHKPAPGGARNGTVLFVHGSSMGSQPTFDLHVPDRPDSSVMDWFARRGFDMDVARAAVERAFGERDSLNEA